MENRENRPTPPPPGMPPAEDLMKKIHELELGHAHLKQEMCKLLTSSTSEIMAAQRQHRQHRSHSISPQRVPRRRPAGRDGNSVWKAGSASFRHSSPLQRESRDRDTWSGGGVGGGGGREGEGVGPAAVRFTDKYYLNILQSMGQSIHIMDLDNRLIYWLVS